MWRVNLEHRQLGGLVAAALLVVAVTVTAGSDISQDHPVVGRFAITSASGGAVWAFQPSGALVVIGPGEIVSEGTWSAAGGEREFDARLEVTVSGQSLAVLGEVSEAGDAVAMYVTASEPTRPEDWTPWPAESRLVGERLGMIAQPDGPPTPSPLDCARPEWVADVVDWDRCDAAPVAEP
jgi:hypothetical protein